jgi:hypothetical protein
LARTDQIDVIKAEFVRGMFGTGYFAEILGVGMAPAGIFTP